MCLQFYQNNKGLPIKLTEPVSRLESHECTDGSSLYSGPEGMQCSLSSVASILFFSVLFTTITTAYPCQTGPAAANCAMYSGIFVAYSFNLLIKNTSLNNCKQEKRSQLYTYKTSICCLIS